MKLTTLFSLWLMNSFSCLRVDSLRSRSSSLETRRRRLASRDSSEWPIPLSATKYTFKQQHTDGKTIETARQTTNVQMSGSAGSQFLLPTLVFQLKKVFPFVRGLNFSSRNHLSCPSSKHVGKKVSVRVSTYNIQNFVDKYRIWLSNKWQDGHFPALRLLYYQSRFTFDRILWSLEYQIWKSVQNWQILMSCSFFPLSAFPEPHRNSFIIVIFLTDKKTIASCHINCHLSGGSYI